jgi:hypothetical protein
VVPKVFFVVSIIVDTFLSSDMSVSNIRIYSQQMGHAVVLLIEYYAISRKVTVSIPNDSVGFFN